MPFVLPTTFIVGDSFSHREALASYPASSGWELFARFVPRATGTAIDITFDADGDDHLASVADTTAWVAGTYSKLLWAELGATVTSIESGSIKLLPDPRVASGVLDNRSDAQTALDNVRATLRGTASANVLRYTINGRQLEHYSIPDLITLESKLVNDVRREEQAATGRNPRRMVARVARA